MSYILDALKRAEQERGVSPRAVPPPREMPEGSLARARGPWIAGGLVGAAALLAIGLWTIMPPAAPEVEVALPPPRVESAPGVEPPRVQSATRVDRAQRPEPVPRVEPAPLALPARPSAGAVAQSRPSAAPSASRAEPRGPAPAGRGAASRVGPPPAATDDDSRSEAVPQGASRAARSPGAGSASSPSVDATGATPSRPSVPGPAARAGDLKTRTATLSLQVISWAHDPKDRFVFVNGRKYGEGQRIDDSYLIERITDDGVVLSFQGERVTLKGPR
jgi:general secretion pathway protein B